MRLVMLQADFEAVVLFVVAAVVVSCVAVSAAAAVESAAAAVAALPVASVLPHPTSEQAVAVARTNAANLFFIKPLRFCALRALSLL